MEFLRVYGNTMFDLVVIFLFSQASRFSRDLL